MTRFMDILQGVTLPSGIDISRLTGWINAFLVLLLAYSMAVLTWQVVATPGVQDTSVQRIQLLGNTTQKDGPGLDAVSALHLLGDAGSAPVVDETPIDAPETRLKFTLKGVFADSRTDSAMAIIASSGNDEKSYRVGDVVAGAATLHQILADRVILKRGGQLETLYLPRESDDSMPGSSFHQPNISRGGITPSPYTDIPNTRNLGGIRKQLMENPQEALQLINAQPVMENGQLAGFRVSPGKDRALFSRAGLRPGDIVTAVNGMQLTDATQMGEVFQQLRSAKQLEVTVSRGGREQQLRLKLD